MSYLTHTVGDGEVSFVHLGGRILQQDTGGTVDLVECADVVYNIFGIVSGRN